MSKSIKQYNKAMDNIKASDDFLSRTEKLLSDACSEESIGNTNEITLHSSAKPHRNGLKITAYAGLAAACITAAFVVKGGIDSRGDIDITAVESVAAITEETTENSVDVALEVDIESDTAFDGLEIDEYETKETSVTTEKKVNAAKPAPKTETVEEAAPAEEIEQVEDVKSTEAAIAEITESAVSISKEVIVENEIALNSVDSIQIDKSTLIDNVNYTNSVISLTCYTKDGYNTKSTALNDKQASSLLSRINSIVNNSSINNDKKEIDSEFAFNVVNSVNPDLSFKVILSSDNKIAVYYNDQSYVIYSVSEAEYKVLEKDMYLCFGSESDYEAYIALKSGK